MKSWLLWILGSLLVFVGGCVYKIHKTVVVKEKPQKEINQYEVGCIPVYGCKISEDNIYIKKILEDNNEN